jgi:hypothetical protein
MRYRSKLKTALMFQERLIQEKEKEISEIMQKYQQIKENLDREKNKVNINRNELEKGRVLNSSYFFGSFDKKLIDEYEGQIKKLDLELKFKKLEYQRLLKKKERIEEMDKKRENEFYVQIDKKEQKEIEDLNEFLKLFKDGGEENWK